MSRTDQWSLSHIVYGPDPVAENAVDWHRARSWQPIEMPSGDAREAGLARGPSDLYQLITIGLKKLAIKLGNLCWVCRRTELMTEQQLRERKIQIARYRLLEQEVTDPLAASLLHVVAELEADLQMEADSDLRSDARGLTVENTH
jgi:hypothetical protein